MNNNKIKPINYERAKWLALYYLGIKARTEIEIRKKLTEKGANREICDKTIDFLKEYGYINDEEYTRMYVRDACTLKKHGIRRIKTDLRMKGVDPLTIENVITDEKLDFEDPLKELATKKSQSLDLANPKHKNRLIGFLQRRGYGINDILRVVREIEEESSDE